MQAHRHDDGEIRAPREELLGPDGDLTDFPPWLWPYIRPASFISVAASEQISVDILAAELPEALKLDERQTAILGAHLDAQLAALKSVAAR